MVLGPYAQPDFPEPVIDVPDDGNGWNAVDSLEAKQCLLCPFGTLAEVPFQHAAGWRKAWATVLLKWEQADNPEEETRALKWLLLLPLVLL